MGIESSDLDERVNYHFEKQSDIQDSCRFIRGYYYERHCQWWCKLKNNGEPIPSTLSQIVKDVVRKPTTR